MSEFIAVAVTFLIMLAVIGKFAWPKLLAFAEDSQNKIAASLDEAEKTRQEVAEALAQSEQQLKAAQKQADEIVARSKKAADEEAEMIHERAKHEADAFLVQATSQIAAERQKAIQELRRETGDVVINAAGQVLSGVMTPKAHEKLIDETLTKAVNSAN